MRLAIILFSIFAVMVPASAQAPDPAPSTPVDEVVLAPFEPSREDAVLEGYVDGVIGAHMREHKAPAMSVSVVRNGRVVFAKIYGEAELDAPVAGDGADKMFRIGSVSKTFTWTAVMMLHERGLIDLDADVNDYLKDLEIPEAFGAPVTMNDLMAHRAGFEDTLALFTYTDDDDATLTQALNDTMPKRVYPPGARTSYSNWGASLAAKIVEDISGVSYRAFLEQEILAPLAMTKTTIVAPGLLDETARGSMAVGYDVAGGAYKEAEYMQIGPFAPAGAMASTANDMAQWMLVHLGGGEHNGARLMSATTHDLMWTRAFDDRSAGADLAHGFITRIYRGLETFGHGGATGAFYTDMTMVPELGLGVYVSQNTTNDRTILTDLPLSIIDHVRARPASPARPDPNFIAKANAFSGTYLNNRRSFSLFEKLFSTEDVASVASAPEGALRVVRGDKTVRYAPLPGAADSFESRDGDRIVFGRDEKGRITHFSDGSGVHSFERVGFADNPQWVNVTLFAALFFSATILLGAWRRQGRSVAQTPTGAMLGLAGLAAALLTFVFAGSAAWLIAALSDASVAAMQAYPPIQVTIFRLLGLAMFIAAIAGAISLWPVWLRSGWGVWRKLHHTLFAIALAALAAILVIWNAIFAGAA